MYCCSFHSAMSSANNVCVNAGVCLQALEHQLQQQQTAGYNQAPSVPGVAPPGAVVPSKQAKQLLIEQVLVSSTHMCLLHLFLENVVAICSNSSCLDFCVSI